MKDFSKNLNFNFTSPTFICAYSLSLSLSWSISHLNWPASRLVVIIPELKKTKTFNFYMNSFDHLNIN